MLPIHIFTGDIPAPCTATQSKCDRHAIIKVAAVSQALGLIDHDAADLYPCSQLDDAVFPSSMDTAAVTLSIYRSYRLD